MAYSIDRHYAANFPCLETGINFIKFDGNHKNNNKVVYRMGGSEKEPFVEMKKDEKYYYEKNIHWDNGTSNYLSANMVAGNLIRALNEDFRNKSTYFQYWYCWFNEFKAATGFNQSVARNILNDLLVNKEKAASAINSFMGEDFARINRHDPYSDTLFLWTSNGVAPYSPTNLTYGDLRNAAYLGLLLTIYEAGTSEQRAMWGPLIDEYCKQDTNHTADEPSLTECEWAEQPTLVVVQALININAGKDGTGGNDNDEWLDWLPVPEWYSLYKQRSAYYLYDSGADVDGIPIAGNNATQNLISYWYNTYVKDKSTAGLNKNCIGVPFSDLCFDKDGTWSKKRARWGLAELITASNMITVDRYKMKGAGVFYSPHVEMRTTSASADIHLTVDPTETQVGVATSTTVTETLSFTPNSVNIPEEV